MRFGPVVFALMLMGLSGLALAQTNPLSSSTSAEPVLTDPVPGAGADYPPSAATAGEAYVGPPLEKADPDLGCSPFNPCAYPSSAPRKLKGIDTGLSRID